MYWFVVYFINVSGGNYVLVYRPFYTIYQEVIMYWFVVHMVQYTRK